MYKPVWREQRYMEMIVKTKAGVIEAKAYPGGDYPSIDLSVNGILFCLLECIEEDGEFFVRVYNNESEDPVFNQKVCTM